MTFVKPDLLKHLEALEALGLEFEFRRLGNDVFNEIGWLDPSGQLIRLIEARTFSPSKRAGTDTSRCGYFLEIALPAPSLDVSKAYWEQLGFVGMDEMDDRLPHVSCTSDYIDLGLYDPSHLLRPTLRFEADDVGGTLARLAEIGISPSGALPLSAAAATRRRTGRARGNTDPADRNPQHLSWRGIPPASLSDQWTPSRGRPQ